MVTFLLPLFQTTFRSQYSEREQGMKLYAAEGAINRVIADMIRGADAIPTTYTTTSPHRAGQSYYTYTITTSYSAPTVTLNSYTPAITITSPSGLSLPATQQNYIDPGLPNPHLATIPAGYLYLLRLYNVKAGQITVNWAYSPASTSRVGVWAGMPTQPGTSNPLAPGRIDKWPTDFPILDTGSSPSNVSYNRVGPINVDPAADGSGGVYTIVMDNSRGVTTKTTLPYQPSGGTADTWVWVKSHRDYKVTAAIGDINVVAYIRQVPGYSEPPVWTTPWGVTNVSFITNEVYLYSYSTPQ